MRSLLLAALVLTLASCASTNYQRYEGKPGAEVVEGMGGTKESLGSFELWGSGTPPRKYKILGMAEIEDFDNFLGRGRIRDALVAKLSEVGADAAISIDASGGGQFLGIGVSSQGTVSTGAGFGKVIRRYLLVKYF
jgi:hypothetical protein